jgi:hypothetical protein
VEQAEKTKLIVITPYVKYTLITYHGFKAKRKRKMEAQKKETTKTFVRKSEFQNKSVAHPL